MSGVEAKSIKVYERRRSFLRSDGELAGSLLFLGGATVCGPLPAGMERHRARTCVRRGRSKARLTPDAPPRRSTMAMSGSTNRLSTSSPRRARLLNAYIKPHLYIRPLFQFSIIVDGAVR